MGNKPNITTDEVRKNTEDFKAAFLHKSQAMINTIMNDDFDDNMVFIKDRLLEKIAKNSKLGFSYSEVYFQSLFGNIFGPRYTQGITDINHVARIIEKLKSFEELRGYEIIYLKRNDLYVGLRMTLI